MQIVTLYNFVFEIMYYFLLKIKEIKHKLVLQINIFEYNQLPRKGI